MALTGINYYSSLIGLQNEKYSAYFDFNNANEFVSGGRFFINSPNWCPASSGVLIGNSGNFNQIEGSGFFTGNRYIKLLGNFPLNNWSVITVFDFGRGTGIASGNASPDLPWGLTHQQFGNFHNLWSQGSSVNNSGIIDQYYSSYNTIIFSSFPSGQSGINSALSGYFCGINGGNKLFFTHWNNVDGPQTYTYSGFVPSKSTICVNKQTNNLSLGVYSPENSNFNFQQFNIYNGRITTNSDWYIGGAPSKSIYYPNLNNFSGYIDEFILLSGDS